MFAEPILNLEEDVRFELTVPFETSVFKTDAIGHSANLPLFFIYTICKHTTQYIAFIYLMSTVSAAGSVFAYGRGSGIRTHLHPD